MTETIAEQAPQYHDPPFDPPEVVNMKRDYDRDMELLRGYEQLSAAIRKRWSLGKSSKNGSTP